MFLRRTATPPQSLDNVYGQKREVCSCRPDGPSLHPVAPASRRRHGTTSEHLTSVPVPNTTTQHVQIRGRPMAHYCDNGGSQSAHHSADCGTGTSGTVGLTRTGLIMQKVPKRQLSSGPPRRAQPVTVVHPVTPVVHRLSVYEKRLNALRTHATLPQKVVPAGGQLLHPMRATPYTRRSAITFRRSQASHCHNAGPGGECRSCVASGKALRDQTASPISTLSVIPKKYEGFAKTWRGSGQILCKRNKN